MRIIDIHVHGMEGHDTRSGKVEDILTLAEIQASHGVTEFLPTIYPGPIPVMRGHMLTVKKAMELQTAQDQPGGARIIGIHLEGPFLNPGRCGALSAEAFLEPTEANLLRLIDGFEDITRIMTVAPELDGAPDLIRKASDRGIIISMGHSDATYAEAEAGFQAGAKGITHIFNAMRGLHHREPGIAGFGLINQDVYVEVIADPFHLHPGIIDLILRSKNPERVIIVSDTVKGAKLLDGGVTDKGGMLLGGCMTVTEAVERLVGMGVARDDIMKSITSNPQRYLEN